MKQKKSDGFAAIGSLTLVNDLDLEMGKFLGMCEELPLDKKELEDQANRVLVGMRAIIDEAT